MVNFAKLLRLLLISQSGWEILSRLTPQNISGKMLKFFFEVNCAYVEFSNMKDLGFLRKMKPKVPNMCVVK